MEWPDNFADLDGLENSLKYDDFFDKSYYRDHTYWELKRAVYPVHIMVQDLTGQLQKTINTKWIFENTNFEEVREFTKLRDILAENVNHGLEIKVIDGVQHVHRESFLHYTVKNELLFPLFIVEQLGNLRHVLGAHNQHKTRELSVFVESSTNTLISKSPSQLRTESAVKQAAAIVETDPELKHESNTGRIRRKLVDRLDGKILHQNGQPVDRETLHKYLKPNYPGLAPKGASKQQQEKMKTR